MGGGVEGWLRMVEGGRGVEGRGRVRKERTKSRAVFIPFAVPRARFSQPREFKTIPRLPHHVRLKLSCEIKTNGQKNPGNRIFVSKVERRAQSFGDGSRFDTHIQQRLLRRLFRNSSKISEALRPGSRPLQALVPVLDGWTSPACPSSSGPTSP